jgi:uncharacterized protein YkwD
MKKKLRKLKLFLLPDSENNYRPLVLNSRFFSYLILILIFAKCITFLYLIYLPNTSFFAEISTSVLVRMANEERASHGSSTLKVNPQLNQAALMKANDMVNNNYFAHWSPQGKSPWHWFSLAGYNYEYAGENLAIGFFDATEVHRAWIQSSSHRANILNPTYQEIGLAVVQKDFYGRSSFLVVQMFGTPQKKETVQVALPVKTLPESLPVKTLPEALPEETLPEEDVLVEQEPTLVQEETEAEELTAVSNKETILGEAYIQSAEIMAEKPFSLTQFLLLGYDDLIQKVVLLSLMFLGFVMLANVFVRFDVQHPDLIFKGIVFLVIFLVFEYFDQATIVRIFLGTPILGG